MHFLYSTNLFPTCTRPFDIIYKVVEVEKSSSATGLNWLAPLVVIIVFIIGQYIAYTTRLKEIKKTWYYKAYLDNSITKLHDLFDSADKEIEASIIETSSLANDELTQSKAISSGKFADLIRAFNLDTILTLKLAYPHIFQSLSDEILNLQDIATQTLDLDQEKSLDYWRENSRIIKSKIFQLLSKPVYDDDKRFVKKLKRIFRKQNKKTK